MAKEEYALAGANSERKSSSKFVKLRKVWVFVFAFLFIVIPVVVGVLVWHFVSSEATCDDKDIGSTSQIPASHSSQTPTTVDPNIGKVWDNYRLPRDVIPLHYHLTLYPNFYDDNAWLSGSVVIEVEVVKPTKLILIHYKDINITNMEIINANTGQLVEIASQFAYAKYNYLVLEFSSTFESGTFLNISCSFEETLAGKTAGFYRSQYVTSSGEKRHMVSAQLEPAFGRESFPSFDEPDLKANFSITLIHKPRYAALANMPEEETVNSTEYEGLVATRYQTSVIMTNYLMCFAVCDFERIEKTTAKGVLVRAWGPPESVAHLSYAMDIGATIMDYLEEFVGIPYPLPKLDLILIPNLAFVAMENWGLVTFQPIYIQYDPENCSKNDRQRIAIMVAHELCHNWFGNLVTTHWWGDIWLNEGFASYFQTLVISAHHPDWDIISQFESIHVPYSSSTFAMYNDANGDARPLVFSLENPEEFVSAFDDQVYSKGASLLRMMKSFVGDVEFKHAIQRLQRNNAWGNVLSDDVWDTFSQIDGYSLMKTIMDTWTLQTGYPYVDVTFTMNSSSGITTVTANQHYFRLDSDEDPPQESPFEYTWYIPLIYFTSENSDNHEIVWMNRTGKTFESSLDTDDVTKWIKFNPEQMGYYRVNYPDAVWQRFADVLQDTITALSANDRTNLINDVFSLARAGVTNYTTALTLSTYMNKEQSYLPWHTFIFITEFIRGQFVNQYGHELLRNYIISKARPVFDRLGWDVIANHTDGLLQTRIISLMSEMQEPLCLANIGILFRQWIDTNTAVGVDVREPVYAYGMREFGTVEDWNIVMVRFLRETLMQEKFRLLYSLTQTRYTWLLDRLLTLALDTYVLPQTDVLRFYTYVSSNPIGRDFVWNWIRASPAQRLAGFDDLGSVIGIITLNFNTEFQLKEVESFFEMYPNTGAREKTLKSIRGNIKWMAKYYKTIVTWLDDNPV